ncbi:hypothetical protein KAU33_12035 [Candidatus Dependentiae bacterium]|nr:hypothetical protein [Candidatus Dependentiae bacterium]
MKKITNIFICILLLSLFLLSSCGKPKPTIVMDVDKQFKKAPLEEGEENKSIFLAMETELKRTMKDLKSDDPNAPKIYYISYLIEDTETQSLIYGISSKLEEYHLTQRKIFVDLRVGDHKFDNFVHPAERDYYDPEIAKFRNIASGLAYPKDNNELGLRRSLWLLTDISYKKALIEYTKKKSRKATEIERKEDADLSDFTKEDVKSLILKTKGEEFNKEFWENYLKEGTLILKEFDFLLEAAVSLSFNHYDRYFYDSEGRKIQFGWDIYSLGFVAGTKADDGMNLTNGVMLHGHSQKDFPTLDEFKKKIREKCEMLNKMRKAPIIEPYSGPVLIEAGAAGVFFHEVLGHRLESQRIRSVKEAETLKDKIGEKIIDENINIFDDPTLNYFNDIPLIGSYPVDEEGIISQRVSLIESGVLKGFLMFRYPIKGFDKSNGHGRADISTLSSGYGTLVARQGNLIIVPKKAYSDEDIMKSFEMEIKKQKKEYGIIVKSTTGGYTITSRFDLQHFVQSPVEIYKYYPGGKRELVRGAEFGGTPLISMEKISAFGSKLEVFNGYCGAESGYVPVSAVAPTILINELEIQKSSRSVRTPPILPSPFKKKNQGE